MGHWARLVMQIAPVVLGSTKLGPLVTAIIAAIHAAEELHGAHKGQEKLETAVASLASEYQHVTIGDLTSGVTAVVDAANRANQARSALAVN